MSKRNRYCKIHCEDPLCENLLPRYPQVNPSDYVCFKTSINPPTRRRHRKNKGFVTIGNSVADYGAVILTNDAASTLLPGAWNIATGNALSLYLRKHQPGSQSTDNILHLIRIFNRPIKMARI